jgi:hopanoid biosynthesis associated protein HpnK
MWAAMIRLIVSGDDFGLHPMINQGIIEAHNGGILTSTSIVPCGQAVDHAVQLAKQHPGISVGIHLTFVEEVPVCKPEDIPSLVNADGRFLLSWKQLLPHLLGGRIQPDHLRQEAEAQMSRILDMGIIPTHMDSHQYLHLYPTVWKMIAPVLQKFKIERIRTIGSEVMPGHRGWKSHTLELLSRRLQNELNRSGIWTPDHAAGTSLGGHITEQHIIQLLDNLPNGTTELICHPGQSDDELGKHYDWDFHWEDEKAALTSKAVRDMISAQGIQLCRFEPPQGES